jgi:predicted kinase
VVLLCGLPGAGKTTLAKQLEASMPAVRLCTDEWMCALDLDLFDEGHRDRVDVLTWAHAQVLLQAGLSIILDASGLWLRSERDEKRLQARTLGVLVELHYLAVPFDVLVQRVARRTRDSVPGTAPVTEEHLRAWQPRFSPPDAEELALFDPPRRLDAQPMDS